MAMVVALGVLGASTGCTTHVDAGHVGVLIDSCSGKIQDTPLPVGWHGTGACTSIVEYPIYQQTAVWTKSPHEGSPTDESITVQAEGGLPVSMDIALTYSIIPDSAPKIYITYHQTTLEALGDTILRQIVRAHVQEVAAKYSAQDLISSKKEEARVKIESLLMEHLAKIGFNVAQFSFNEMRVPDTIKQSIEAKVGMAQKTAEMQAGVARAEAEGRQHIATTEAAARQLELSSRAQADANDRIARSLTPLMLQYLMIQKWDGKLPTTSCGGGQSNPFQLVLK
jgi:regulator of protease activity HflC (stomatin/prohibitin superfamily)